MPKRALWSFCFALLVGQAHASAPDSWRHNDYAYDAHDTPLSTVLADFAREFGVTLDMPDVPVVINGQIRAASPVAFLERLAGQYQLQWFVYSGTLYVSPASDQTSARLNAGESSVDDLKQALEQTALLDSRFGWGALPDDGAVLVSGPSRYVTLVTQAVEKITHSGSGGNGEVIVLPLTYASAADRNIAYRGQTLTVPGVAHLLQDLLQAGSRGLGSGTGGINTNTNSLLNGGGLNTGRSYFAPSANSLGGASALGNLPSAASLVPFNMGGDAGGGSSRSDKRKPQVKVTADVRNNAVLVYDQPERRAMYESVVRQLDLPRNVIEIDAVILDVDRNELADLASRWNLDTGKHGFGADLLNGGSSTLSFQNAGRFQAELRALEGRGSASVIANPSILTLENQPAVIDFSRTEFLTATGERVADIQPITAGTSLQVVPHAYPGGGATRVQLTVDIEDGQIDASTLNASQPSVRKGNVSTQAVVAERGALVIGGFHAVEANDRLNKIPLLGDIPWLGKLLFQSREREFSQRERLFVITPRRVGDQVEPARYVQESNRHDLEAAVHRVAERDHGFAPPTRVEVQDAFRDLAEGIYPRGLKASTTMPFDIASLCVLGDGLPVAPSPSQWYQAKGWGVAVVKVSNLSGSRQRIDESACGGRWALGVASWPHAWLQPGEQSEVFIALRQPLDWHADGKPRTSLLEEKHP